MQENHHNLILEELNRLQSLVEQVLNLNTELQTELNKQKNVDTLDIKEFTAAIHVRMVDMKSLIDVKEHELKTELQKLEQKILDVEQFSQKNIEKSEPITLPKDKDSLKEIRKLNKELDNLKTALEDKSDKLNEDFSNKIYLLSREVRNEVKAMYSKLEASIGFQEVEKRIKHLHNKINAISNLSNELGGFEKVLELVTKTLKELQTEMAKHESLKKEILNATRTLIKTKKEMELLKEETKKEMELLKEKTRKEVELLKDETKKTKEKLELMNGKVENPTQDKEPKDGNNLYLLIGIVISLFTILSLSVFWFYLS